MTGTDPSAGDRRDEADLVGYSVAALDGSAGSVESVRHDVGAGFLAVTTGSWLLGRTVVVPASAVDHVDHVTRTVHLDRTRNQVMDSPEYSAGTFGSAGYHERITHDNPDASGGDVPMM